MRFGGVATLVMMSWLVVSCSQEAQEARPALVTVNGKPIYQEHVEAMLAKFPDEAIARAGDDFEEKILESLVRAKAVAEMARADMSARELERIKSRAELYEEELLAAEYLKESTDIEPVTGAMVREYYDKNQQRYLLGNQVTIQYLQSESGLEEPQKRALMKKMSAVEADADWKTYQQTLAKDGFRVFYRSSEIKASLLAKPLDSIVASLEPGEASAVFYGETLYRVRLVKEEKLGYQPLSAVSGEIRRKLAPIQMKKAIKLVSEKALASAKVEYAKD